MKRARKAVYVANSIRLKRQRHQHAVLVVEGPSDKLFFEKFADREHCVVTAANGRRIVKEVVDILVASKFEGIVGVVDGDATRVGVTQDKNLFLLDSPDLEVMLIQSRALDSVLIEFGSVRKRRLLKADVRDLLIRAARPIGCFRIHSLDKRIDLTFDGIKYVNFVDIKSLELDRHKLVHEVKRRSQLGSKDCTPMLKIIETAEATIDDSWAVCCGDDLVSLLGLGLRKMFGTNNAGVVSYDVLSRSLRLAYSEAEFRDTRICAELIDWAVRNEGYRVLNCDIAPM